jgi:hypothetical protein
MRQLGEQAQRIMKGERVGVTVVTNRITIPGASCRRAAKPERPAPAQRQQAGGLIDLAASSWR